jgi:S-adenosylmethionine:tRNA ribosyltransferase-isomerase
MRVERFAYDLPPELIAQAPPPERELARLMVLGERSVGAADTGPQDSQIAALVDHVPPGCLLVVNDTKVIRARILGRKDGSGGKAEVFLVRKEPGPMEEGVERWRAMARASKPLRLGTRIVAGAITAEIEGKADDGLYSVRLRSTDAGLPVADAIEQAAEVPLPPYIKRKPDAADTERYQTIFARVPGAVAAPTAGLHLTAPLLKRLEARGCEIASCTLHVGLGTFEPVKTEDLDDHVMHAEYFEVSRALASAIARARERGAEVLAVGTTVVRALESAADPDREGHVRPCAEETRLLIQPGAFRFRVVDRLLTNFHLPRSTLLALVCAFAGTDRVLAAYRTAVERRYRFFSYGDAMLLPRDGVDEARPASVREGGSDTG